MTEKTLHTGADTKVTLRRVVQFIIDSFIISLIPGTLYGIGNSMIEGETANDVVFRGMAISFLALGLWVAAWYALYIAYPHRNGGQTLAMKWLGLRVVTLDGGLPTLDQFRKRWVGLALDAVFPIGTLLGLILIIATERNQRLGDMWAQTLVVRA